MERTVTAPLEGEGVEAFGVHRRSDVVMMGTFLDCLLHA